MKKNLFLTAFSILFFCVSCEDKTIVEKIYYKNGNLKAVMYDQDSLNIVESYDSLGYLDLKIFVRDGKNDSLIKFNRNGTLRFSKKTLPTGATYSVEYDSNGNLDKEGLYINDTIKAWWWKFYKKNKISAKREYVIICDDYYLNQEIILNEKNDTVLNKSTFLQ
ncbi:hypothetical protein GCM10007424_11480 [Flavobacterium suaedae]|uniref:DUF4595 domain-containing protein n=1 Tax=Flavobacterium suaedae TaxID=1767027 RepID=A0ABQ1JR28_9FLAO|nr:hypothetical protein [Flavobacterium suaedae]GGB73284.1 hypothetical protein GCM10007424_11480 [Flavobacterium suaedae]